MSRTSQAYQTRVERFRTDLTTLQVRDLIRKHITTGMPAVIEADEYYELRKVVAEEFNLHPSAVVLVGSCRTGFSIKPRHRYRLADSASDFDLAMVSQEQFDRYWDSVFEYAQSDVAWKRSPEYRSFVRMLFNGWIDPRGLPSVPRFVQAERWVAFFDNLMASRRFGARRITARLYRTWDRLESYQERAVHSCRAALARSN